MNRKIVLVLGKSGQLGQEVVEQFSKDEFWKVIAPDESIADITIYPKIEKIILNSSPDIIVNCAAFTNVDGCETNPTKTMLINAIGSENIARATLKTKAFLIHISTDYVYDGIQSIKVSHKKSIDSEKPLNVYGMSKLYGENLVQNKIHEANPYNYLILRTSGLYGKYGKNNFLFRIEELIEDRIRLNSGKKIKIIADQKYCPTSTLQLAKQIKNYADMMDDERNYIIEKEGSILNACSTNYTSPYIFLTNYLIFKEKYLFMSYIEPIHFDEYFKLYPNTAKRPKNVWLKNEIAEKYSKELNAFTTIEEALEEFVGTIY